MLCLLLTATLGYATPSSPESFLRSTVEWLTSESSLVFRGKPIERDAFQSTNGHWIARERYQLDEVLKGPLSTGDTTTFLKLLRARPELEWYSDRRDRLVFCRVARRLVPEMEGRYTSTLTGELPTSFVVEEPPGNPDEPWRLDHYYTPELEPILHYAEIEGRARRHIAWEKRNRRGARDLDRRTIARAPRKPSGVSETTPPVIHVSENVSAVVRWPLYYDRRGRPQVRWADEVGRSPARIELEGDETEFVTVKNSQHAFSNRRYAWVSVPFRMRGWRASVNAGGERRTHTARVVVSGHVFMAAEPEHLKALEALGWSLADTEGDLDLTYSDRGFTKLKVVSRYARAGTTVAFPALSWVGAVVLRPPAWL